ncbi:nitroreductase family deazaflavin-dependent oxidoreductase [Actinomycetospora sp. CA-084318]|uniref:nitroreductase family deazaflavin-dependent oxidoreductase n=1 Tax=Actinomycetospora sp. CA-084318 TaxID=3239892 RepID=UPI003D97B02E
MVDARAMNRQMVERLLAAPAEEPAEDAYALRVVETRGRTSGEPRRTPLAVVRHGGRDHLVTPDPSRDWAQNLLAHPEATLRSADGDVPVRAERIGADEGAPVVQAYLAAMTVPWALKAFPVSPDDPLDTVRAHMDGIAVWWLRPVSTNPCQDAD